MRNFNSEFNGYDINVGAGCCIPTETTRDDKPGEVKYSENPQAGKWAWAVTKTRNGRVVMVFSGEEASQQAALRAAQEQASCAPKDRRDFLTKV